MQLTELDSAKGKVNVVNVNSADLKFTECWQMLAGTAELPSDWQSCVALKILAPREFATFPGPGIALHAVLWNTVLVRGPQVPLTSLGWCAGSACS